MSSKHVSEVKPPYEDVSVQELGSRHDASSGSSESEKAVEGVVVPEEFKGTQADKQDMNVLGRRQVLRRNFEFTTMLGFASTVMVAWEGVNVISIYSLENGGTAIIFWAMLTGIIGMSFVYASLAEMASMFPTSGGQYHWVSELAPPRFQKQLSYAVGWLTAMGWQVFLSGTCFIVAGIIQGLIVLNNLDTYIYHRWHATLLTIAVVLFVSIFNTVFAPKLPLLEGLLLILHIGGLFAIIIPLWVMAPRGNAHTVLLEFTTTGGWSSLGLSALIGAPNLFGTLVGYDCVVHMSEEVKDASRVLPKALMWTVLPNGIMALLMATTFIFCIGDVDQVLASPTGEPFIQVFKNATRSNAGATVMASIIAIMHTSSCISEVATASRQLWAFARDRGLPFSGWLSQITPGYNIPLRGVLVTVTISCLLSLINIGSAVALNAINSLAIVSVLSSYIITIGCMIFRRFTGPALPPAPWGLGRWGLPINIVSICFLLPLFFFAFWPVHADPTPSGLNWSPVMFVGVLLIAAVYYAFWARKEYRGPVVLVKRDC